LSCRPFVHFVVPSSVGACNKQVSSTWLHPHTWPTDFAKFSQKPQLSQTEVSLSLSLSLSLHIIMNNATFLYNFYQWNSKLAREMLQLYWELLAKLSKKLSPKTKANLIYGWNVLRDAVLTLFSSAAKAYPKVMKWGDQPVQDFKQPSTLLLAPAASWTLFWFPLQILLKCPEKTHSKKTIYIGNQQIYGNGTISLVAAIYKKVPVLCSYLSLSRLEHVLE
jgi:hypothetical protein